MTLEMTVPLRIHREAVRLPEIVKQHSKTHGKLRHCKSHGLTNMRPHREIMVNAVLLKANARLDLRQQVLQYIRILLQNPGGVLSHDYP